MNHKTFIAKVMQKATPPNGRGWQVLNIGRYRLTTNGTEWSCIVRGSNRRVTRLDVVIQEWNRVHG